MTKCPHCFQPLPPDAFGWVCDNQRCTRHPDRIASRYAPRPVQRGKVVVLRPNGPGWRPPARLGCDLCREPMNEACPHCHGTLLDGWRNGHAVCIAMNGARATGKSVYIAVVVKQLQRLAHRLRSNMAFADARTRDTYTEIYEKPLFVERGLMAPTPSSITDDSYQRAPLVFNLGMIGGRLRYLVIRDVAGEEMERPPAQAGHLRFLAHADGIFFLFDPLAVPNIRERLVDLVPAQLQLGGDPRVVLGNMQGLIGRAQPNVAVVLSKFDALHALQRVEDVQWSRIMSNAGAAFLRDPSENGPGYDVQDGLLLNEEVKSLLYRLGGEGIVHGMENPASGVPLRHQFFAVSALGESPDGRRLNPHGIAPFRCLDPVKWILHTTGVLPAA
ncbi:MAG: hypothetical protein Q4E05_01570 [Pseudoclavibacter sp.]|nr:hypothetical protein [Pseudoclavibacter sp.]